MATYKEKIASAEAEIQQLKNRAKEYRQKMKKKQGQERTHRICQRGGYIEKVLKETIELSDENFREFIDKTLTTKFSLAILNALTAKQNEQAAVENTDADTPNDVKPAGNGESLSPPAASTVGSAQVKHHPQVGATANGRPPEAVRTASQHA